MIIREILAALLFGGERNPANVAAALLGSGGVVRVGRLRTAARILEEAESLDQEVLGLAAWALCERLNAGSLQRVPCPLEVGGSGRWNARDGGGQFRTLRDAVAEWVLAPDNRCEHLPEMLAMVDALCAIDPVGVVERWKALAAEEASRRAGQLAARLADRLAARGADAADDQESFDLLAAAAYRLPACPEKAGVVATAEAVRYGEAETTVDERRDCCGYADHDGAGDSPCPSCS